jgi:hypothetical protein
MVHSPRGDHHVFHVGITGNGVKYSFENIGFYPMPEAFEDGIPVPEPERKVTPRRAGSGNPQNGFHQKATVATSVDRVAFLAITMRFHQSPLGVADNKTIAQHSHLPFLKK